MNSSSIERVIYLATKDPKRGARVVAKVFYKILRRQGYSDNQIIDITTNILSCLITKINGCEKKVETPEEPRKEVLNDYPFQRTDIMGTYSELSKMYRNTESMNYCV